MIGSNVIIFPDTGPEFFASDRASILYADHVYVLTKFDDIIPEEQTDNWIQTGTGPFRTNLAKRLKEYHSFTRTVHKDLMLAQTEGVLTSLAGPARDLSFGEVYKNTLEILTKTSPEFLDELADSVLHDLPPSLCDIASHSRMMLGLFDEKFSTMGHGELWEEEKKCLSLQDMYLELYAITYFVILNVLSEQLGAPLLTSSNSLRKAALRYRSLFVPDVVPPVSLRESRRAAEMELAKVIIRRHLPLIADVPLDEIFELRQRRRDELEAFRVAVAELATKIDLSQRAKDLDAQVHDLVLAKVDPALQKLRVALASARLDAIGKASRLWKPIGAATASAVVCLATGAPLDVGAAASGLAGLGSMLIDYGIHRKKLIHASQWSVLLRFHHLNKAARKS